VFFLGRLFLAGLILVDNLGNHNFREESSVANVIKLFTAVSCDFS
jgi:hypothetical protein